MTAHQKALGELRGYLRENVDLTYGMLWEYLRQYEVVSHVERETIQEISDTNADQVDNLIKLLRRKEELKTKRFIQSLTETEHREVARRLSKKIASHSEDKDVLYFLLVLLCLFLIVLINLTTVYMIITHIRGQYEPIAEQFTEKFGKITLWGSSEPWSVPTDTILTPLALVKNNRSVTGLRNTTLSSFSDIFEYPLPLYVIVTGEAGLGKTTLTRQVALDWAERILKGNIPPVEGERIHFYLPVELKHVTENDTLESFLRREFRYLEQSSLDGLMAAVTNYPQDVVIMFDGLDEMSKNASKHILSILKREDSTYGLNIVITTREHAAHIVRPSLGKSGIELKLTGFDWEHIFQYVTMFFSDSHPSMGKEVLDVLWKDEALKNMARSPMLLQLLCIMRLKGKSHIRHRTSVYSEYLKIELNRYRLEKHPELYHDISRDLLVEYKEVLMKLGTLYFEDCEGNLFQTTFSRGCIEKKVGKEIFSLGLLDTSLPTAPYELKHVGFIHRSFQEYLAALAIAFGDSLSEEALVKYCQTPYHVSEKKAILQFLAGLSSDISNRVMQKIQTSLSDYAEEKDRYKSAEMFMLHSYGNYYARYSQWMIVYDVFLSVLKEHVNIDEGNIKFISLYLQTNSPDLKIIYKYSKINPSVFANLHALIVDGTVHSIVPRQVKDNITQNFWFYEIFNLAITRNTLQIFEILPSEFFIYLSLFYEEIFSTKITKATTLVFDDSSSFLHLWVPDKTSVLSSTEHSHKVGDSRYFTHVIIRGNNNAWSYERILTMFPDVENMRLASVICKRIAIRPEDEQISALRKYSKIRYLHFDISTCNFFQHGVSFDLISELLQLEHIYLDGTMKFESNYIENEQYLKEKFPHVKVTNSK